MARAADERPLSFRVMTRNTIRGSGLDVRFSRRMVCAALAASAAAGSPARAHDLERTQVSLAFERDGTFVLDVSNDPSWLKLRMEPFHDNFIDRVVLWVDGREMRPDSAELIPARGENGLATYRLRGRMPADARALRWYYGLVVDPYPLTIRRADNHIVVEEMAGDAWSRSIDLTGQFASPLRIRIERQLPIAVMVALFACGVAVRYRSRRRATLRRSEI
jgi:hypothetical protein